MFVLTGFQWIYYPFFTVKLLDRLYTRGLILGTLKFEAFSSEAVKIWIFDAKPASAPRI